MDALRARAYLDIRLGMDSRSLGSRPGGTRQPRPASPGPAQAQAQPRLPAPGSGGPRAGMIPPGFAGQVTLTIPEATLTGPRGPARRAGRHRPVDPGLARDLAAAAAGNPQSTWCVTVPTSRATPSATAAPGPLARRENPDRARSARPGHGSPSPPPISPARPAGTAPGGSPPGTGSGPDHRAPAAARPGTVITAAQARGHDPRVMLRQLAQVRHAACTGPGCRRPVAQLRLRAPQPVRCGRPDLPLQREPEVPPRPPAQASTRAGTPSSRRRVRLPDHALGTAVRHRADPISHLRRVIQVLTDPERCGPVIALDGRKGGLFRYPQGSPRVRPSVPPSTRGRCPAGPADLGR